MQPLLRIQSIPIKIEAQTKRATLQASTEKELPSVNITRRRGGMNVRTTQPQVDISQQAARNNSGLRSVSRLTQDFANMGAQAAKESAINAADEGSRIINSAGNGNPIAEIAAESSQRTIEAAPDHGPYTPPEITGQPGSVSFDYQMDSLTFDWNVNTKPQLEYIPPSIEYSVTQYPEVIIEYIGEPIYVPARANPNYVPKPGVNETA